MHNAPLRPAGEAIPATLTHAVMTTAWVIYRMRLCGRRKMIPVLWRECLRQAWRQVKSQASAARTRDQIMPCTPRPMTPMKAAIDWTKYLPAHMSQEQAIREIRARYSVPF